MSTQKLGSKFGTYITLIFYIDISHGKFLISLDNRFEFLPLIMYVTFLLKYTPQGSCDEPVKISCTPRMGSNVSCKRLREIENFPRLCVVYFMKKSNKNHLGFNPGRIFVQQDWNSIMMISIYTILSGYTL